MVLGYLLVTVGYVYGTIMLIIVLLACLVDAWAVRDRRAALKVLGIGALLGLVAVTVYLPGVLTSSVTARSEEYRFGGKFTVGPLGLLSGVLPTSAVPNTADHLAPYAYLVWFLPVVAWLGWRRLAAGWRPIAGLLVFLLVTLVIVDGLGQFGPLRWPLRLQPFLVEAVAVTVAVTWTRFGLRRPSPRRLAGSLAWVVLAGALSLRWADEKWRGHLLAVVVVAAGLVVLWLLVRAGRPARAALAAGLGTLVVLAVQHATYPDLPSPNRWPPTDLTAFRAPLGGAVGDVMQVGASDNLLRTDPPGDDLLLGSGVVPEPAQHAEHLHDDQLPHLQEPLLRLLPGRHVCRGARDPVQRRADDRAAPGRPAGCELPHADQPGLPQQRLDHPPMGWRVEARTPNTTLWPAPTRSRERVGWRGRRRAPGCPT